MTAVTQINFNTDPVLKNRVLEKAKKDNLTLKSFLNLAMQAYADDKINFGLTTNNQDWIESQEPYKTELNNRISALEKGQEKLVSLSDFDKE